MEEGPLKDQALRLCYHLQDKAPAYINLLRRGELTFKDPDNQANWDRFIVVLGKVESRIMQAKSR